jgi:uncharacterized membrane protein YccC
MSTKCLLRFSSHPRDAILGLMPGPRRYNEVAGHAEALTVPAEARAIAHCCWDARRCSSAHCLRASRLPSEDSGVELAAAEGSAARVAPIALSDSAYSRLRNSGWVSNPTLATMGCYLLMTLTDWTKIHTCMSTCVVARKRLALSSSVVSTDWWR